MLALGSATFEANISFQLYFRTLVSEREPSGIATPASQPPSNVNFPATLVFSFLPGRTLKWLYLPLASC